MDNKYKNLNGIYREIAEEFGEEVSKKFYEAYKGLNINFPVRYYDRSYVVKSIRKEYNGKNIKDIARKYDYSERWIRKILKEG